MTTNTFRRYHKNESSSVGHTIFRQFFFFCFALLHLCSLHLNLYSPISSMRVYICRIFTLFCGFIQFSNLCFIVCPLVRHKIAIFVHLTYTILCPDFQTEFIFSRSVCFLCVFHIIFFSVIKKYFH